MSEENTTRKVSVTFERKLGHDNYGNSVARAWVEGEVESDASDAVVGEKLAELFGVAKAAVLDELGIEAVLDERGILREKYAPEAQTSGERALRRELGGSEADGFDTKGIKVMNFSEMTQDVPEDIAAACNRLGINAVWERKGSYGPFYVEAVAKGESPILPSDRDPSKGGIIKANSGR